MNNRDSRGLLRTVKLIAAVLGACLCQVGVTAEAQTLVPDDVTCSGCVIQAVADADIGTLNGAGSLPQNYRISVDQQGRFWVIPHGDAPMIFDAQGRFVTTAGRVGEGPGEVRRPVGILLLPGDSVGLFELGGRIHVYDAALRFHRTVTIPITIPLEARVLSWPDSVLVHAEVNTPERRGFPFHIVDLSSNEPEITATHGSRTETGPRQPLPRQTTVISKTPHQYWTAPVGLYRVTRWSGTKPIMSIVRRPDWFDGESDGSVGGPDTPPSPRLIGLHEDEEGLLWIYLHKPSEHYRKAFARIEERLRTQARSEVRTGEIDWQYLFNTIVEVFDPRSQRLVARYGLNRPTSVLSDGRLAVELESPENVPFVRILRLKLVRN